MAEESGVADFLDWSLRSGGSGQCLLLTSFVS
jgi:hypothetical protein